SSRIAGPCPKNSWTEPVLTSAEGTALPGCPLSPLLRLFPAWIDTWIGTWIDSVSCELKGAGQMRRLDANALVPFVSFPAQHRLRSARHLSTKKRGPVNQGLVSFTEV